MLIIRQENASFIRLDNTPLDVLNHIKDEFSFIIPQFQFKRKWGNNKNWNGKVVLLKRNKYLYSGLLETLMYFLKKNNYSFKLDISEPVEQLTTKNITDQLQKLPLNIQPHDYQLHSVTELLLRQRLLLVSPTASGKSYILFLALVLALKFKLATKILIVVPTISLVLQLQKDFLSYCGSEKLLDFFSKHIHCIYQGQERHNKHKITISTYQSLIQCEPEFFTPFDLVIADEVHLMSKSSGQQILENSTSAKLRWGLTGTLQDTQLDLLVLTGLFGKPLQLVKTKELIDKGFISNLKINNIILRYDTLECKKIQGLSFQKEYEYIISHKERQSIVNNFVSQLVGNSLVLFTRIELQGEQLYENIKSLNPNKHVVFLTGRNSAEERENARQLAETHNNVILICSYGIFSTGISINNLHNIIFASPYKAKIKVLQSIGRGLRKHQHKLICTVYDFVDDARFGQKLNYFFTHFLERLSIYGTEGFDCTNINYPQKLSCSE